MPRPQDIQDPELRELLSRALDALRSRKADEAVRILADAYLELLRMKPEMLTETIELRPGRKMPAVLRWPALGANLSPDSVRAGEPVIEFTRERFATSEAMTYYQYTLESALEHGA